MTGGPEHALLIGLLSDADSLVSSAVERALVEIDGHLPDSGVAFSAEMIELREWIEPPVFPWSEEETELLVRPDLVVADATSASVDGRTILGFLTGRGAPIVMFDASDPPTSLQTRLLVALNTVVDLRQRAHDTACIEALGYSANGLALANAAALNQTVVVAALLRMGVSPDSEDAAGIPALNRAIRASAWDCAQLLLDAEASVDHPAPDRDSTPLIELASTRQHDLIEHCLTRTVDIDHRSQSGQTALMIAVGAKNIEMALALLDRGADPHVKDSLGMTAGRYAEMFGLTAVIARVS